MSNKKLIDISDATRGGNTTKERHGSEHFAKIGELGRATIRKKDPDFYKRLAAAGFYARQVKLQTEIARQLGEKLDPSVFDKLSHLLIGKR